jgi:hypothetical protein
MAKARPGKKPQPAPSATTRVLPMQLQIGDRLSDETGEWEIIARPYSSSAGKIVSARVRRVGQIDVTEIRTWSAHERVAVKRGGA